MRRAGMVTAATLLLAAPAVGAKPPKPPKPPKPASSVTIAAAPNPVVFGSRITVSGQATGNKSAGAIVTLYAKSAPTYKTATKLGSTTADATGHYSFRTAPGANAIYYVTAKTAPAATSPTVLVKVRVKIGLRVSTRTPASGARVRFSGFVLPAYNGRFVLIQRKTRTGWRTLARAKLVPAGSVSTVFGPTARSKYGKRVRIVKSGIYRVFLNPKDGLRIANSASRRLRVH